jgi:hypothetical protein
MGIRKSWAALGLAAAAAWGSGPAAAAPARGPAHQITVFKSPTCGCCRKWVEHLRAAGFQVIAHDTTDLEAVMTRYGVPHTLASCHTAVVEGYVIEGHVPADLIARLLTERPKVAGLAVPGMPANAPGMDMPSPAPYHVLTFDHAGKTAVYATR